MDLREASATGFEGRASLWDPSPLKAAVAVNSFHEKAG
jgi:hypothetical protein